MNIAEIASASALIKQELAPLTEKIGQGAEFTFGLFVKQVYVIAFSNLLWIIPGIVCLTLIRWLRKQDWDGMQVFLSIVALCSGLAMILIPFTGLIQAVVNPEFGAIQLIVETFKTVK